MIKNIKQRSWMFLERRNCRLLTDTFLKLGFVPCKAEQLLRDMGLHEKEVQKN